MDPLPPPPDARADSDVCPHAEASASADAAAICAALARLLRHMSQPRIQQFLCRRAGVEVDKVSEVVLSHLVERHDTELRMSDLAKGLGVELSSVSRKVQKLEDAGLITRSTDPSDARAWRLHLTEQGKELVARVQLARQESLGEALHCWSEQDRKSFVELFERFTADMSTEFRSHA